MPQESRRMVIASRTPGTVSVPEVVGRRRPSARRRIHWSQFKSYALPSGIWGEGKAKVRWPPCLLDLDLDQIKIAASGALADPHEALAVRVPANVILALRVANILELVGAVGIH